MTWQTYGSFVLFAALVMLIPGPDFAVVVKNAVGGGRWRGSWAAVGALRRAKIRRALDAATGTVLVGFGARLALESP